MIRLGGQVKTPSGRRAEVLKVLTEKNGGLRVEMRYLDGDRSEVSLPVHLVRGAVIPLSPSGG